ncbi:MAG TPA: gamma-glutamylcyclotransferase family protein [Acidimicrobiia bacterium]|nr:gamma-glutamylcyclotransferase family protein [Acidimicrobiia bacterium]
MAPQAAGTRGRRLTVRLFVYGTLAPGSEAWPVLEPWTVGVPRLDAVAGRLYDTGRGYPAATFGDRPPPADQTGVVEGQTGVVEGIVVTIDPARAEEALAALDRYEGAEYRRVAVRTRGGVEAAAYDWIAPIDGLHPIPGGSWPDAERQAETRRRDRR